MVYFTQLIFIHAGQEELFHQFEDVVLPLIPKYNGKVLLRLRPDDASFVELNMDRPYEIHLVEFEDEQDFLNYGRDEIRQKFLHMKDKAIVSSLLIRGNKI